MIFYDLLRTVDIEKVFDELYEIYPDQIKNDAGYKGCVAELLMLIPVVDDSTMEIILDWHEADPSDEYGESGYEVHGKPATPETKKEVHGDWYDKEDRDEPYEGYYAIEYTPWEKLLSYEVRTTIEGISNERLVACILWEITWAGYSNKDIQLRAGEIFDSAAEVMESFSIEKLADSDVR